MKRLVSVLAHASRTEGGRAEGQRRMEETPKPHIQSSRTG